ncbi:hypothetical protein Aspvir_006362 [Aspergillus viridinutans]|uniref:Uncharacterized protein n=1 Tax=Aspergillus viridinutans TaxID=75553 RepID=A0A9P3BXA1_ASPVI|nr:uncharacterized protein Aspvir_006362 [Aspergillus viridinutans]GIK02313.1 hypothetical protein Aspvir_006362 [Aspergillus viridinutans]
MFKTPSRLSRASTTVAKKKPEICKKRIRVQTAKYVRVVKETRTIDSLNTWLKLNNPACLGIFIEEIQQLYVGQNYDLYWTHNMLCPSVSEYLKMVDLKAGGLFRILTRLTVAESPIRDDYQNLASVDYAKQKGFAEDLNEG